MYIINVFFSKFLKKNFFYFIEKKKIKINQYIIAETSRGIEMGQIIRSRIFINNNNIINKTKMKTIIRIATETDIVQYNKNILIASEAHKICNKKIFDYNLKMKLVNTEITLTQKKILFYFYSIKRIDFRNLVKDLAYIFKIRIEMRQLNLRDRSYTFGGIGMCGKQLCCSLFNKNFEVKKENKKSFINLNKMNIGLCNKSMCCLNYEKNI